MKPRQRSAAGLTRLEVLVVVCIVGLVAALLLASLARKHARSARISCIGRLKNIALSAKVFANDHNDWLPGRFFEQQIRSNAPVAVPEAWPVFQIMSNELATPRSLVCPADGRRPAADFASLRNANVSYFISVDADNATPEAWQAGDRYLEVGRVPLPTGLQTLTTNPALSWGPRAHARAGNLAFADGSIQRSTNAILSELLIKQGLATNRVLLP